ILHGKSARKAEFANLQTVMLDREGPFECPAFVLVLKQGKTNQFGRIELAACLRNSKVEICPFMALRCYFFWRWHIDGEQEMPYSPHLEAINRAFKTCRIVSTAKIDAAHGSSARMADMSACQQTAAAHAFLELLKQLRITFLQDSVLMMSKTPGHPLWQHGVFHDPEYIEFKRSVEPCVETDVKPTDILLQRALPLITRKLADMQ
ncbi:hypothetical protein PHYBLDRAFT_99792, partial [Phycomyces blakesleeanus NRRL 1555(-)]